MVEETGPGTVPVPRAVFTVRDLPERQRYEVWSDSISCIFDVDADRETRKDGFFASVDASMFGSVMLARTSTPRQRWSRAASTIARDGMDHYMIQLYESGSQKLSDGRAEAEQVAGDLAVYDLARPVTARTDVFTNLSLIIPRGLLAESLKMPDDQHIRTLSAADPTVALLRDHMISLKKLGPRMTDAQAKAVVPATVALAATCLNASAPDTPRGDAGVAFATLTLARRLVEANLGEEHLTPAWLTRQLGMSRAKLYRLFEPIGGIAHYIRERRLRRALLELADDEARSRPIYDIALAAGFSSETAFGRAFRQRYGVTPRDVRARSVTPRVRPADHTLDRRYEDWLQHLAV
ncbi:AraC family transcriptional regulator [Thalassobaculum fulvum]|uniref:AraC family transcriptional regulator n=1 Tax=Thalassobaculum fulvum TaxID=1633335 RepID=A0A918XSM0_9PROT|nr:helix-turn-helix domain-containing protein [Thalassobaculum fulvum]GHD52687.1 AraC family transcriptional regulator [Thalassobaculum fulvum]